MQSPHRHRDNRDFHNKISATNASTMLTPSSVVGAGRFQGGGASSPPPVATFAEFPDRSNDRQTGHLAVELAEIQRLSDDSQHQFTNLISDVEMKLHNHNHDLEEDRNQQTKFEMDISLWVGHIDEREHSLNGLLGNLDEVFKKKNDNAGA